MYLCTLDLRKICTLENQTLRWDNWRKDKTGRKRRAPFLFLCIEVNSVWKLFVHNGATQRNIQHFDLIFFECLKKLYFSCTTFWFWDRRPDIYAILFSSWLKIATHDDETEWHKLCLTWLLGRYILTWLVMIDILLKCTIGEEGFVPWQRRLTRRACALGGCEEARQITAWSGIV